MLVERLGIPAEPQAIYFCGPNSLRKSVCLCIRLKFSAKSVNGLGCMVSCSQSTGRVGSGAETGCTLTWWKEAVT